MRKRTAGFSLVEILLGVVVVALLTFIGYRVWVANNGITSGSGTASQASQQDDVPQVNDVSDLSNADSVLNSTNVDGDTLNQLETELTY